MHAVSRSSHLDQPPCILFALRQEELHILHDSPQGFLEPQVPGQGAVGDTGIHNGDSRARQPRQVQQVRPELALGQYHQFWPQRLEVCANRERQVNRNVEHVVLAEALARQLLSCVRRGRDNDAPARQLRLQLVRHPRNCQYLADGDSMDPDRIDRDPVEQAVRDCAQTLAQACSVFPVPQHLQQPPWHAENQRKQQEKAVERIHAAIVIALRA